MKITHVAEIVNITNVAGILEAEICVAENMRAVLMYNQQNDFKMRQCIYIKRELLFQCCCISIIVIDLINFIGPGPHSHNAPFWSDFDDLSGV